MKHRDGRFFFLPYWSAPVLWCVCATLIGVGCTGPREAAREGREGDRGRPGTRVERVYYVQIRMTEKKVVADRTVGTVMSWWRERPPSGRPSALAGVDELPVTIAWRPPLYRVRIGPFASRQRAEVMLDVVDPVYPDAFIAPHRVRSRRAPAYRSPRPFARHSPSRTTSNW